MIVESAPTFDPHIDPPSRRMAPIVQQSILGDQLVQHLHHHGALGHAGQVDHRLQGVRTLNIKAQVTEQITGQGNCRC